MRRAMESAEQSYKIFLSGQTILHGPIESAPNEHSCGENHPADIREITVVAELLRDSISCA